MYTLYDFLPSGNGYKVRLILNRLNLPYKYIEKNILADETKTEKFLRLNSSGRIPLLQLENGECLAESNAILMYLAEGSPLLPTDRLEKARVLQWLFFEQYSHEPNIAVVRFWMTHGGPTDAQTAQLASKMDAGYAALAVMETQLQQTEFLVGTSFTVADIALYAYTHVAHEGGFDLSDFPAVSEWLFRVQAQPGYTLVTDIK